MKTSDTQSVGDVLGQFGITESQLTSQVATVKAVQKLAPCFRFNIEPREAFLQLYKLYQEEVQSRYLDFNNDTYTQDIVAKVPSHIPNRA